MMRPGYWWEITSLVVPGRRGVDGGVPGSDVVGPPRGVVSALDVLQLKEHLMISIINIISTQIKAQP